MEGAIHVLTLALWGSLSPPDLDAEAGGFVDLHRAACGMLVVPVRVGDSGPHDFLLDTGAGTTVIDPALAREVGAVPVDRVRLVGPGGLTVAVRAKVARLSVGNRVVEVLS
jgi:predicted aspartyl protease